MTTSNTCAQCGATLLPTAAYCGSCGEPVDRRDQLDLGDRRVRLAPRGKRVLAFGIDLAVLYGVQTVLSVLGTFSTLGLTRNSDEFAEYRQCVRLATTPEARSECIDALLPQLAPMLLLSFVIPFLIALIYWSVCNTLGTSIGKRVAGIRIAGPRGGRPGVARGLLRTMTALVLSGPVLGLGYLWAFWQPRRRMWHDMIAGTYVVRVLPHDRGQERAQQSTAVETPRPPTL